MISLFLNTASSYLNIAILVDKKIKKEKNILLSKDLSKMALVEISDLIKECSLTPDLIEEIICVRGPGSFTGLRVGVTIAKTFAYSLKKKLYSLSTLELMATSVKGYDYIVPLIDARRSFVYAGIYDSNYKEVLSERYIGINKLKEEVEKLKGKVGYVSLDSFKEIEVLKYEPDLENTFKYVNFTLEDPFTFVPNYLKLTQAEENRNNDKGN